jgi:hypothetical protein
VGWADYVQRLNSIHGLEGDDALSTLPNPDLPPAWFIGDVTRVVPEQWALVFSLNPKLDRDTAWYLNRQWDRNSFWEFQTNWLRCWWNRSFHGPLTRLARYSIQSVAGSDETVDDRFFAARHLVFVELCPYASQRFALSPEVLTQMASDDIACKVEAEMTHIMLQEGRPALVLVNGNGAISSFETINRGRLDWVELSYKSVNRPEKALWHKQGYLHLRGRTVPIAGFPFLRKPATHNFYLDIQQLGDYVHSLLGKSRQ